MPKLAISRAGLERIHTHALADAPAEACGVLVGRRDGANVEVERLVPTKNAHPTPSVAYLIDPEELLRTLLLAEDEWGLEVVGFYHSHPRGPARMSEADIAHASWPDAAYLLLWSSPVQGSACFLWREGARAFEPCEVVVRASPP